MLNHWFWNIVGNPRFLRIWEVFACSKKYKKLLLVFALEDWKHIRKLEIVLFVYVFMIIASYYCWLCLWSLVSVMILKFWVGGCCSTLFLFHCAYCLITVTLLLLLRNEGVYAYSVGIILHKHVLLVHKICCLVLQLLVCCKLFEWY